MRVFFVCTCLLAFALGAAAADAHPGQEILVVGSSSIAMWGTMEKDLLPHTTIRWGVGGTGMDWIIQQATVGFVPLKPRILVVYTGENDIAAGRTPQRVSDDFKKFVGLIHAQLPRTRILFVSMKPSPSRAGVTALMADGNARIRTFTETDPRLGYIDVFTPMLDAQGHPRPELFSADMLHMNADGYRLWTEHITPWLTDRSRLIRRLDAGQAQLTVIYSTSEAPAARWITPLQTALDARYPAKATVTTTLRARKGSSWIAAHIAELAAAPPDTLILDPAAFDALKKNRITPDQCRMQVESAVTRIKTAFPQCEIILVTPRPAPIAEANAFKPVAPYVQAVQDIAAAQQLRVVNFAQLPCEGDDQGVQANALVLDALDGYVTGIMPTRRQLLELYGTLRFSAPLYHGAANALVLSVVNPTDRALTLTGHWQLPKGLEGTVQPDDFAPLVVAPRQRATRAVTITLPVAQDTPPVLTWTATVGVESIGGNLKPGIAYRGQYLTGDSPVTDAVKLPIQFSRQCSVWLSNWQGKADCSAVAWLRRETDGLRVRAEVTDDVLIGGNKHPWENDAVELYFDFRPEGTRGWAAKEAGFFQVVAVPGFGSDTPNRAFVYDQLKQPISGIAVTSGVQPGGYWVEIFLPFAGLTKIHGTPGDTFLFAYSLDDSDAPGVLKSQLHWTSSTNNPGSPNLWAVMTPSTPARR
jgi:hypothetical protein